MPRLVEYVNPHPHAIQIVGPNRETVRVEKYSKVVLSDWYIDRYTPKFLRVSRIIGNTDAAKPSNKPSGSIGISAQTTPKVMGGVRAQKIRSKQDDPSSKILIRRETTKARPHKFDRAAINRRVVGRAIPNALKIYDQLIQETTFAVSNNIGIGILSYNRLGSLQRLVNSIRKYTDLAKTTVFVSDDGSTSSELKQWLSSQSDLTILNNPVNIGIAGNSNRLLNCLSRFKYKILLNDDVEIKSHGWDRFYANAIAKTGYHHFCYRQEGLYGASRSEGRKRTVGSDVFIQTIGEKPHGAVMAFDDMAFNKVGFFDEQLDRYGMEHVDWSNRVGMSGLQPIGFHDIAGSDQFFYIHREQTATQNKGTHLRENKALYERLKGDTSRIFVSCRQQSSVPSVSVIVPIRDVGRTDSANVIINCIKAQRFPDIEIIIVEQDNIKRFRLDPSIPVDYLFVSSTRPNQEFNKARAFNQGVLRARNDRIILHDADIIVQANYVNTINAILSTHEGCHIGSRVLYLNAPSTTKMNQNMKIEKDYVCERAVGYFEGGSIACHKDTFFKVGGFNEDFEGYGVEDCDFFERLKGHSRFFNDRSSDMLHMWHSRVPGWEKRHKINKDLMASIKKNMRDQQYIAQLVQQMVSRYPETKKYYG